jgi:hypothetical protein
LLLGDPRGRIADKTGREIKLAGDLAAPTSQGLG